MTAQEEQDGLQNTADKGPPFRRQGGLPSRQDLSNLRQHTL
jgi:hypothetical protein